MSLAVVGAITGVLGTLIGTLITYLTFIRGRDKEIKNDAHESAKVSYKLDHIGNGVEDIKLELKDSDRQIGQLNEKVARIDEGVKSAHSRINKLEGR